MISLRVNEIFNFLSKNDEELLKKCHQCMEIIVSAKDRQAAEANKNATILLEELDLERSREESKRAAAARKRERRRKKRREKAGKEQKLEPMSGKNSSPEPDSDERGGGKDEEDDEDDEDVKEDDDPDPVPEVRTPLPAPLPNTHNGALMLSNDASRKENGDITHEETTSSSQSVPESSSVHPRRGNRRSKRGERDRDRGRHSKASLAVSTSTMSARAPEPVVSVPPVSTDRVRTSNVMSNVTNTMSMTVAAGKRRKTEQDSQISNDVAVAPVQAKTAHREKKIHKNVTDKNLSKINSLDTFGVPLLSPVKPGLKSPNLTSPKRGQRKEEGWKEVVRKPVMSTRSKKVSVPSTAISRVIGRGGCNINAIREVSGAHIEVDKQKGSTDRIITIKGSTEATRQAHNLISALVKDPDKELEQILARQRKKVASTHSTTSTVSTTSVSTISASNVWHNSMAIGIPTTGSTHPTSTSLITTTASSRTVLSKNTSLVSRSQTLGHTTSSGGKSSGNSTSRGSANGIPGGVINVWGSANSQPSTSTPRPSNHSARPGMLPMSGAVPSQPDSIQAKSPSMVVRQLFPTDKKTVAVSSTSSKATITYTTASTSKTKVISSTVTTTAVSRAESSPVMGNRMSHQQQQKPNQSSGLRPSLSANYSSKVEPQPLPIKSASNQNVSSSKKSNQGQNTPQGSTTPVSAAPEYSPFNNLFSQVHVAERVLGKKDDGIEGKMNFASVAAAGVVPPVSIHPGSNIGPGTPTTMNKPSVNSNPTSNPAKAPGYKAPGTRTSSPQFNEPEMSRAPGFKVTPSQASQQQKPVGQPLMEQSGAEKVASLMAAMALNQVSPRHTDESDMARAPGYKGPNSSSSISPPHNLNQVGPNSVHLDNNPVSILHMNPLHVPQNHAQSLSSAGQIPLSQSHMVSSALQLSGSHGQMPLTLGHLPPNQLPMPFQQNFDPRVPGFKHMPQAMMSPHAGQDFGTTNHMGEAHPGHGPARDEYSTPNQPMTLPKIESTLNPNAPDFTSTRTSALPPGHPGSLNQAPPAFNPAPGGVNPNQSMRSNNSSLGQPPHMNSQSNSANQNYLTQLRNMANLASMMSPVMMGATGTINVPSGVSHQFNTIPTIARPASTPAASTDDSSANHVGSQSSPSTSSAPSPSGIDDRRLPRPIGTERAHKKPVVPGFGPMGEAAASGLWAFQTDMGGDWLPGASAVMANAQATGVSSPGLPNDGIDERPASQPSSLSPHLIAGHLNIDPSVIEQTESFQGQTVMVGGGIPAVFTNGVVSPSAAAAVAAAGGIALPPTVFPPTQAVAGDALPAMWNQQSKMSLSAADGPLDPKMWNNWNPAANM